MTELSSLIDPSQRIGTVTRVTASAVELTLPNAFAALGRRGLARGSVGDFVFVDCDRTAILGRVTEVSLPDRQRSYIDQQINLELETQPQGRIQLLATVSKTTRKVSRGIDVQPRVGDSVYLAAGAALATAIKDALEGQSPKLLIELGYLVGVDDTPLGIPPEKLFGRHCGVFGATGGGKSWTVSRLMNEIVRIGGKCILFDPTGEFTDKVATAWQYSFSEAAELGRLVRFPSEKLSELDLHAILTPTGQSQGPALRGATKSLRMSRLLCSDVERFPVEHLVGKRRVSIRRDGLALGDVVIEQQGTIEKAGQSRIAYGQAELELADELAMEACQFDFKGLSRQVRNECVRPVHSDDPTRYGYIDNNAVGYCNC